MCRSLFERDQREARSPCSVCIFAFLIGLLLFLPFPGWQNLVGFITSATVLMYAGAPLALGALRHQKPDADGRSGCGAAGSGPRCRFIVGQPDHLLERMGGRLEADVAVILGYVLMGISRSPTPTRSGTHGLGGGRSGCGRTWRA